METIQINITAVFVAVIANFLLGFLWYTPLFGKVWVKEMRFDINVKPTKSEMARGMIVMVIGNFFMAYVFAHNIAAWGFVPEMIGTSAISNILNSAVFTWMGFYLPVDIGVVTWERKSWKLFGINTSYHFLMLLVAAVILTYMK